MAPTLGLAEVPVAKCAPGERKGVGDTTQARDRISRFPTPFPLYFSARFFCEPGTGAGSNASPSPRKEGTGGRALARLGLFPRRDLD